MTKLTGDTAISLSLAIVLCGVIWKISIIKATADTALEKSKATEVVIEERRKIRDHFERQVISDLAILKERLGVRGNQK